MNRTNNSNYSMYTIGIDCMHDIRLDLQQETLSPSTPRGFFSAKRKMGKKWVGGGGSKKGGSHTQRQKIHVVGTRTYKPSSFLPYFVSYIILIAYISLLENWGHICAYFIIYEYENSLIIGGQRKRRDVHPQKVGVLVTHLKILTRIYTKRISGTSISITLNVYTGF